MASKTFWSEMGIDKLSHQWHHKYNQLGASNLFHPFTQKSLGLKEPGLDGVPGLILVMFLRTEYSERGNFLIIQFLKIKTLLR